MSLRIKTKKKRTLRQNSNVFAMFDQSQIQEFKEAFSLIDQDGDGFIESGDLKDMLASLGQNPPDEYIDQMIREAPGSINFTMFLTILGERLTGFDQERDLLSAFECFDETGSGMLDGDALREFLTTMGDRFTDEDVDILYKSSAYKNGLFNYREFVSGMKHGV